MNITTREKIAIYCMMMIIKIIKPSQYDSDFWDWEDLVRAELSKEILQVQDKKK